MICEESYSQGTGLLNSIRVPTGSPFLQSRVPCVRSVSWWVNCVAFSLEWRLFHYIVNISHLVGVVVLKKNSNILLYMTFEREPGPCLSLQYGFSLLLPCLYISSLISNCLNLPFGTQRRSWMFNEAYFLQTRDWGHRKYFGLKSPTGFYVVSISN